MIYGKGIYQIINKVNGKIYVGSSVDLYRRNHEHTAALRRNKHCNVHLQRAWNEYGESNFKFIVLEQVTCNDELFIREQYWIDKLNVCNHDIGYNICPTADRSLDYVMAEETRHKLSLCKRRNALSESTLQKYSMAQRGENNPGSKLTDIDVIEIKKMLMNKVPHSTIAKKFGVIRQLIGQISVGLIWTHVKVAGFTPTAIKKKLTLEDAIEIKKMLMQGILQKTICKMYNISDSLVSNINNELKWKSAHVEGFKTVRSKATRKLDRVKVQEIKILLKEKQYTQKELAEKYGVSIQTISEIKNRVNHH